MQKTSKEVSSDTPQPRLVQSNQLDGFSYRGFPLYFGKKTTVITVTSERAALLLPLLW